MAHVLDQSNHHQVYTDFKFIGKCNHIKLPSQYWWDNTSLHVNWDTIGYRENTKRHHFYTDLLVGQDCQLPLCSPLPIFFIQWPVCSLAQPRNNNSCHTSHNTIYYFLAVQWTTRRPIPFKINCLLDDKCHPLFTWPHVSNLGHLRLQQRYRSTYSLYWLLRRIG